MRSKLSIIFGLTLLALVALASINSPVEAQGTTKNHSMVAQATAKATVVVKPLKCDDPAFLKQLGADLTDYASLLQKFDPTDTVGITKTLLSTIALRQKYEDLDGVKDNCVSTQNTVIDSLSNYGDAIALVQAAKTDPDNAKAYLDAVPDQITRANTYLKSLNDLVGANK